MSVKKFSIPAELYIDNEYNKIRRNKLILIAQIIEDYIEMIKNTDKAESLSEIYNYSYISNSIINLEQSVYNKIKNKKNKYKVMWDSNFTFLYTIYCDKITKNMDVKQSTSVDTYLIDTLLSNKIDVQNVINMTSYNLAPNKTKDIIKKIKDQISIKDQEIYEKTSSMYTCKKCNNKKVKLSEFQSRSVDEASTLSIECIVCQNIWMLS